jgi:nucleotide-binding universal stress UspA family protein
MDPTWRRVLWLADFAFSAGGAASSARWLRSLKGIELHLLHVAPPCLAEGVADFVPAQTWQTDEAAASDAELRDQLARFRDAHRLRSDTILALRRGQPGREAIRYAEEARVDLIVLSRPPARRRSLFEFSGIAMRVVAHAPCAVLMIPELDIHDLEQFAPE